MVTEETDVLVVGAGPVGLTLAAGLLQRGVRVRIIDMAERANPHSKAIILWPRALEAFDALGAGEDIYEAAVTMHGTNNYTGDRRVGGFRMKPLTGIHFPFAVSLPQSRTEEFLRAAVERRGGQIEFGRRLVALDQDDNGVVAELAGGTALRASWVVGADGAHSTVREQLGVPFDGAPYPQSFVLVDGEYDTACLHDESYYLMGPQGVIVVVGLPGGLYRVFASVPPGQEVENAEQAVDVVRAIAAERSPLRLKQLKAHGSGVFRIHARLAQRMRSGRVLLAGDAAHIHSPAGGLGLNTGVEDAHALAWRLAGITAGTLPAGELDAWEQERLFVARGVIAETDRQTKVWMLTGWRRLRRDLGIRFRTRTGIAQRVLPRRMAQLDLVLPVEGPGLKRLRPGVRIPDAPLGDGRRLRELLRAGGHLLLATGDDAAPALAALDLPARPEPGELRVVVLSSAAGRPARGAESVPDPGGRIRKALSAPRGALCLVRPDGTVAAACAASDTASLAVLRGRLRQLTGGSRLAPSVRALEGETT